MGIWEGDHGGEVPFSFYYIKLTRCQHDMSWLVLTITGLMARLSGFLTRITPLPLLLRNILNNRRYKYLTLEYLEHQWMLSHLRVCVSSPLWKCTLILHKDREAQWEGETQSNPSTPEKRDFKWPREQKHLGLNKHPVLNVESWISVDGEGYILQYLWSKLSHCNADSKHKSSSRLDVCFSLMQEPRGGRMAKGGKVSLPSSTHDNCSICQRW